MMTSASWSRISADHPFQPGSWPDACGYVDEQGWTCGYTRAEHTHISERKRLPHKGQGGLDNGPPVKVQAG